MTDEMHPYPCARCGRTPATGFASINDEWFCHGDDDPEPTCYMQSQSRYIYEIRLLPGASK